jgi:hypothetical protein
LQQTPSVQWPEAQCRSLVQPPPAPVSETHAPPLQK